MEQRKQGQMRDENKGEAESFNIKLSSKREREKERHYPTSLSQSLTWCEYPVNLG